MIHIHWWDHITNVEVLQKTGLSTISEILRNRRLSLFGHVACLDPEVPANKALLLMVNIMRAGSHRQAGPDGPDLRAILVAPGSTLSRRMLMLSNFHLYGELRFPGVMGRRQDYAKMMMIHITNATNSHKLTWKFQGQHLIDVFIDCT